MRAHGPGLWSIAHPPSPEIRLGTRTTLAQLETGGIALIAPGPLTQPQFDAIGGLGPLETIVIPNYLHHLFVTEAIEAFPNATLLGPEGVGTKRPGLRTAGVPDRMPGLRSAHLLGMSRVHEWVFLHENSKSLILTDLCFNIQEGGWMTAALMTLNGAWKRFGPSRLCRHYFTDDAKALAASLEPVLAWDFERVVVCHGEVAENTGPDELRAAFGYLWPSHDGSSG